MHSVFRDFRPQWVLTLLMASGAMGHAQAAFPIVQDPSTGLTWTSTGNLADSEAQGFQVATSQDVQVMLTNSAWVSRPGALGQQYALAAGSTLPALLAGNGMDTYGYVGHAGEPAGGSASFSGFARFLTNGEIVVVSDEYRTFGRYCSGGSSSTCSTPLPVHTFRALIGNLDALKAGAYDSTDLKWSAATVNSVPVKSNPDPDYVGDWVFHSIIRGSTYYVVSSAVPEPSTWALMGLGLIAVAVTARRPVRS